jgi:ferric-dicitrate binding protein FerR (iron transport regulator)
MNYYQFNAEDFAADDYFMEWVCAPNDESETFWQQFLKDYPERYYHVQEGRMLVQSLHEINRSMVGDHQVDKLWSRIDQTVSQKNINPFSLLARRKNLPWLAAASVILLLGIGWIWQTGVTGATEILETNLRSAGWKKLSNDGSEPMQVILSDGSKVFLESSSQIRYAEKFSGPLREVYLEGEAFFEVQKDPSKPFLVYSNGLITKVLGTSFTIKSRSSDPEVTVSVKTGRVSVYSGKSAQTQDPESHGIVLIPNQKAVFRKELATLSKTLVEKPTIVVRKDEIPSFVFEDAPASKVFATLEKVYGIEVVFDEEIMKDCTLTINLNEEDLFQKLEVICKVLDVKYKLIDAQVIIYSSGCSS